MKKALEDVILVKLDMGIKENKNLAKSWKLKGAPAFALLANGEPQAKWSGYSSPDKWVEALSKARKKLPKTSP